MLTYIFVIEHFRLFSVVATIMVKTKHYAFTAGYYSRFPTTEYV